MARIDLGASGLQFQRPNCAATPSLPKKDPTFVYTLIIWCHDRQRGTEATDLHILKLDLRTTVLAFSQSPGTFLWHVDSDLTTCNSLSTSTSENVWLAFKFHLTCCDRSGSFRPTINYSAFKLLAPNVIEVGWKRDRAKRRRRAWRQYFLRGTIAAVTTTQMSRVETDWIVRHALSVVSSSFQRWRLGFRRKASTTSQVFLYKRKEMIAHRVLLPGWIHASTVHGSNLSFEFAFFALSATNVTSTTRVTLLWATKL